MSAKKKSSTKILTTPRMERCIGCRGPSDKLIEKESSAWFESIEKVFRALRPNGILAQSGLIWSWSVQWGGW